MRSHTIHRFSTSVIPAYFWPCLSLPNSSAPFAWRLVSLTIHLSETTAKSATDGRQLTVV